MSNNSVGGNLTDAGAVDLGGSSQAAPAQFTVGAVGFGPAFDDDEVQLTHAGWKSVTDGMAASIIRLECQKDELNAEVALLREQARIMQAQNNELREVMADIVTWVEGDLRDTVDASYRKAVERAQKLTEGLR